MQERLVMENTTEKVRVNLTAKDARKLSETPIKFVNMILKNVRDVASFGDTSFCVTGNSMSEESEKFIVSKLSDLGYSVKTFERKAPIEFYVGENQNELVRAGYANNVSFLISW